MINPPRFEMVRAPAADVTFMANRYPPLGLLYVATWARDVGGHDVQVYDYELGAERVEAIGALLDRFRPEVVGITAYTVNLFDTYRVAEFVRSRIPDAQIVLGGPHVEVYPEETIRQPFVDYLIEGEGERAFVEFLERLSTGTSMEGLEGLHWVEPRSGEWRHCPPRTPDTEIDALGVPDRQLLDERGYHSILNPALREATMVSSRGCPYRCTFCNVGRRRYRYRSPAHIVDEMLTVIDQGYNFIQFVDDTFNLFEKKVLDLCDEILRRGVRVPWSFRGRVDHVSKEMVQKLKAAGCVRAYFGVESGNPEVLAATGKGTTIEQARAAFQLFHKYGIETIAYLMIGFPDETPSQIDETIRFARELRTGYAQILITIPFPGTELYRRALEEGGIPGDYFREYSIRPIPTLQAVAWNRYLDEGALYAKIRRFYRTFYLRPGYLIARVKEVRDWREFVRKARAASAMIGWMLTPTSRAAAREESAYPHGLR